MRQYLKGIAKLRREFVGTPLEEVRDSGLTIRDRWGDTMEGDFVIFRRSTSFKRPQLGKGNFSKVYAIDENRVLKVTHHPTGDVGYKRFVDIVLAHQHNPYFPKIYYRGEWQGKPVYVMERLEKADDDERAYPFVNILSAMNTLMELFTPSCPHLAEALRLLVEHKLLSDLGIRNIMKRNDGTFVITDPAAEDF